jgi:hypothetical protein
VLLSGEPGTCVQRNLAVDRLLDERRKAGVSTAFFSVFFDDDFRPAPDWLERCQSGFVTDPGVVALTGRVLADGIWGEGLSEELAVRYLGGKLPPMRHFSSGLQSRDTPSVYGCNMAFRDRVVERCRFDETLPLYAWQEDQDYTSQALAHGRAIYFPDCRGVHLGTKSGRVSGLRFGYSQVANPLYLVQKGTMPLSKATRLLTRNLAANLLRGVREHPRVDYRGRLRGNVLAIGDILGGRCRPARVLDFQ